MSTNCISCLHEQRTGIDLLCDACRIRKAMLQIDADTVRDIAAMEMWWKSSSNEDRLRVWKAIQQKFDDPVMEIVSRFAQVAFSECVGRLGLATRPS